ncbi:SLOG family protein [Bradyrhizobium elkanii]|uniref:SLOG family protein n=1 Tax=Bradyrhizobium elkanii TaxID=29448 RepID=UPI000421EA36|nr:SLOG family protein [Bradyrhizobium elkanii]
MLVCGSRKYRNRDHVWRTLDQLHWVTPITCLIHGGATGADAFAAAWGKAFDIEVLEFLADWHRLGPSAGPKRNADMIKYGEPELVIAFPGNSGTNNMIEKAEAVGIPVVRQA